MYKNIFNYLITEAIKSKRKQWHKSIVIIITFFLFASTSNAQNNPPAGLKNYLKQCDILLQNEGKWKAVNKEFNAKEAWSASYFGYEFSRGINKNVLQLKITGYFPKKSEWLTFWNGYYTWDPKKQKVIYQSVNSEGAVANGASENINETGMDLIFTVTTPTGKVEKHKDVQKIANDQIQSNSFTLKGNKWEAKNAMTWSKLEQPTGKIIFMSTRDGNWEIYSADAKGDSLKNLSCSKASEYTFSYTSDGRLVYSTNRDGNDEIYIMEADGKKQTNITNHPSGDRVAIVSPDEKKILFSSYRDEKSGELYIMDIDGKNITRLTNNKYFEDPSGWSNDGNKIYFARELRDLKDTSSKATGNMEIFVMDTDGKNEVRLTNRPGGDGGAQVSPDGNKIAFYGSTAEGNYEIFLMDTDGKNIINLTEDPMEDYSPAWSPDGKWIAYTKGNAKNYDVWIIHLETKIKYRITSQPKRDESPIWMPVKK